MRDIDATMEARPLYRDDQVTPDAPPAIPYAVDALEKAVAVLDQAQERLINRLGPVLNPRSDAVALLARDHPDAECPLANHLHDLAARLGRMADYIDEQAARVQL